MSDLISEQRSLEEQMRDLGISRFHKEHSKASKRGDFSSTLTASHFIKAYFKPYADVISEFTRGALSGKPGRRNIAAVGISKLEPEVVAYLFTKAVFNKVPVYHQDKPCTFVGLAIYGAGLLHDELRMRYFAANWRNLVRKMFSDFDTRELPRHKRKEHVQSTFANMQLEWSEWDRSTMLHIGAKLIELFIKATGKDIEVVETHRGKRALDIVQPNKGLLEAVERRVLGTEALNTTYLPCVIPPIDWSQGTLNKGGYHTEHATPYPLVKGSKKAYRMMLKTDGLPSIMSSINALQQTPWRVNSKVLEALEYVYSLNKEIADLPNSDANPIPPLPAGLDPKDRTSEASKEYRKACYITHDKNRRDISKRVQVVKCMQIARMYQKYDSFYFPHDLDSRGRAYPKPALLNPQGPDYAKGLLEFAVGKQLRTPQAVRWLAIHGANCFGYDKASLDDRYKWVVENQEMILSCAKSPMDDLRWTKADAPFQFLAFCLEWAGYDRDGLEWVSHIHVDVDATCSGLQHFSAMLRDGEGGRYVNMVPGPTRQDIYYRVAEKASESIKRDLGGDNDALARAWISFGLSRSITKRSVMVVPYAGTFHSCMQYTADAVEEQMAKGAVHPWPNGKLHEFTVYGAKHIWEAISTTVVAAVGAMNWLSKVASMVAKVPGAQRVEWVTPLDLPVHQAKWNLTSTQVKTWFDGTLLWPRIVSETDKLDPRQMASSVAPSFVHSLDATHMMMTIVNGLDEGITSFAAVHDSFGVHAVDMEIFASCIRDAFVYMYETHDVLAEFLESAKRLIPEEQWGDIPPLPPRGTLDIRGVYDSQFFFS